MAHFKGTRLTYAQRVLLSAYGVGDIRDWVYIKTETTSCSGSKNLSKNQPKESKMVFQNINTGELKKLPVT